MGYTNQGLFTQGNLMHHVENSQKWEQCSCYIDKLKRAPKKQDAVSIKLYMKYKNTWKNLQVESSGYNFGRNTFDDQKK